MGDLVATCMSRQSRNRHVGEELGRGRLLPEIIAEMNMVAEGVKSSRALQEIAQEHDVDMPIVEHVVKVVHDGMDPRDMVRSLMARDPTPEFWDVGDGTPTGVAVASSSARP
jgi:glycerol-3-phosphate dehydrogenase (NAD(P)+)